MTTSFRLSLTSRLSLAVVDLATILLCVAALGCSSTVIFPAKPLDAGHFKLASAPDLEWLSRITEDDAYVQITATITSPDPCITPIANSSLRKEQIGLVLSIRREGFEDPPVPALDL